MRVNCVNGEIYIAQRVIDDYLESGEDAGIYAYREVLTSPFEDGRKEEQDMFGSGRW